MGDNRLKIYIPSIDYDAFKGVLILLVIVGHCQNVIPAGIIQVIYWFHMPCFFMLSGSLAISFQGAGYKKWISKKIKRLLIPQVVWFVILTYLQGRLNYTLLSAFFKGARNVGGVYWYIPVLFIDLILFEIIRNMCKGALKKMNIVFVIIYTLVIIFQYKVWSEINTREISFSIGVALLCLVYMFMGYVLRIWYEKKRAIPIVTILFAVLLIVIMIVLYKRGIFKYNMNLVGMEIGTVGLNLLIPLCCMICLLLGINIVISNARGRISSGVLNTIRKLGRNSLLIMYLHKYILNDILEPWLGCDGFMWMFNVVLTIIFTQCFLWLLSKVPHTVRVILGGE